MSVLEAFLAGKEARRVADAAEQINAMQQFIGQNGAAIMGGDANALGQLAGFGQQGVQMAMGIQGDMQARERQATLDAQAAEDRAYNRKRQETADQRSDQKWEMELAEYRKGLSDEEAAAEAAKIEDAVKMGLMVQTPEEWDKMVTEGGAPELVGQFDNREAVAARFMSIAEVLKQSNPEPPKPTTEVAKLKADLDAGLIDQATYEAELARRAPKGTSLRVDPTTGAVVFEEGVGVGGTGEPTVGDVYNPAAAKDAVGLIDDILGVDAQGNITPESRAILEDITGSIEGGGGNDIDQMSAARRAWYGDKGLDKIEKLNQLQSKAWLAARDMLKGGGPITDYESKKAEAAVARLSRAKGTDEFIAALVDLNDAIKEGERKLREAKGGQASAPGSAPATPATATPEATTATELSDEELLRMYGGE